MKKSLGFLGVFSIAAGAMISSGLFVLPGIAFEIAGPATVLAYVLASLLMVPTMLAKAELATAMPRAGGSYFFIERSMGPMFGTIAGLTNWLSIALKAAFALVGLGSLGALFFPGNELFALKATAVVSCLVFTGLNLLGAKESGRLQVVLVLILLGILMVFVGAGGPRIEPGRFLLGEGVSWPSIFAVTGMVFVSYGGLTKVAAVAEEVINPGRNLPYGMLAAFIAVSALYVVAVAVVVGVVEAGDLAGSLAPLTLAAERTMGPAGSLLVDVAAFLAFATTANAGLMAASRAPLAMSRDGLMAGVFARVHPRRETPGISIAVTSGLMLLAIVFLSVEDLVKTASTMMLLLFMLDNAAIIIMRQSGLSNYRPLFRARGYPWLYIAALVIYAFLLVEMGRTALLLTLGFVVLSLLWFAVYVYPRAKRESALKYMIRRLLDPDVGRAELDNELAGIVLERDAVRLDRLDRIIGDSVVLDVQGPTDRGPLFARVCGRLQEATGLSAELLEARLEARERESSTVLRLGIAFPHCVVPGENVFHMALVRSREGIRFEEDQDPVHAAFFFIASEDQRNFYLRALMTIAQVVQGERFIEHWTRAGGDQGLRELILFARQGR